MPNEPGRWWRSAAGPVEKIVVPAKKAQVQDYMPVSIYFDLSSAQGVVAEVDMHDETSGATKRVKLRAPGRSGLATWGDRTPLIGEPLKQQLVRAVLDMAKTLGDMPADVTDIGPGRGA